MQQRRVRLGDILDDYCPRERRITNHAVVAMIDDTVKQTRCTTCDADHEYREARIPAPRRRRPAAADGILVTGRPQPVLTNTDAELEPADEPLGAPATEDQPHPVEAVESQASVAADSPSEPSPTDDARGDDEWPVHRPLIRATLPRPEGQAPERKAPDFTFRPAGGRFDSHRNGQRKGGHRPTRRSHGQPSGQGRFGGSRPASGQGSRQGSGHGQRHGNRAGGNRSGHNRGTRPGGGGRKRGR
jgi:hypothetical protein